MSLGLGQCQSLSLKDAAACRCWPPLELPSLFAVTGAGGGSCDLAMINLTCHLQGAFLFLSAKSDSCHDQEADPDSHCEKLGVV